jgi:hypothetical protein
MLSPADRNRLLEQNSHSWIGATTRCAAGLALIAGLVIAAAPDSADEASLVAQFQVRNGPVIFYTAAAMLDSSEKTGGFIRTSGRR